MEKLECETIGKTEHNDSSENDENDDNDDKYEMIEMMTMMIKLWILRTCWNVNEEDKNDYNAENDANKPDEDN